MKSLYRSSLREVNYNEGHKMNSKINWRNFLPFVLLFVTAFLPLVNEAAPINMKNGAVISSCSDNFYDSGGPFDVYKANEKTTLTIYPATPGAPVTVDFTSFYIEDGYETLDIYDGPSTSASHIGTYSGSSSPGTVTSTSPDGSLTFSFYSDGGTEYDGWEATVSCGTLSACSGVVMAGDALSSLSTVCPGVPVTFTLKDFTAASDITYQWDTSSTGTGAWSEVSGATTIPLIFIPPAGKTLYYRCRMECASSGSTSTSTSVAVTVDASVLPYFEDFESTAPGSFPPCSDVTYVSPWGEGFGIRDYVSRPSFDNHTPGGTNYLFGDYIIGWVWPDYKPDYYFSPAFELETGKTYEFSFWYMTDGYDPTTLGTYIGKEQNRDAMTTSIGPDIITTATAYEQYVTNFNVASKGFYFIGIKCISSNYYGFAIDDIGLIELAPCTGTPAFAGKASVAPGTICGAPGSADLAVKGTPPVSGLTFQWYESSSLSGPYTVIAGGTTNPYTRSGITEAKYFYCEVGCAAGGGKVNTDTTKVKITPIDPPYIEDFESGTSGVNMPCASYSGPWDRGSFWYLYDGPHSWASLENHTSGGSKWLFAGAGLGPGTGEGAEYWFSPAINFIAGKAYTISYWYKTEGAGINYNFGARIGSSQSKSDMTTVVGEDISSSTATYTKFSGDFVCGTTAPQYLGIRFEATDWYTGCAIDDIGIEQLPPCSAKPAAGMAFASPGLICSPGESGAALSLKGLSAASDLSYQWQSSATGAAGSFSDISAATLPSYDTDPLSTTTYYRCIVTCSLISAPNTDTSEIVEVLVGPLVPPYIETFESATVGVNQPCAAHTSSWESSGGTGDYYDWGIKGAPGRYYPSMDNHTPGGSKYLSAGNNIGTYSLGARSGDRQYWFSPPLQLTGGMAYKCTYWYVAGRSSGATNFGLYYGSSQSAAAMLPIRPDIIGENNTTYKEIVGSLNAPTTGVYYIGIKVNNTKSAYSGIAIDDIGVEQLPLCTAKPSAGTITGTPLLICSSGTATLSLSGTSMASKLEFQWQVSVAPFTTWTNVSTGTGGTTATYTTGTLTEKACYRCIVKCPLIGAPNADTTPIYCQNVGAIIPPYTEDFETGSEGVNMPCASYTYGWSAGYYWYLYTAPYSGAYTENHTPGGKKYLYAGYGLVYSYAPQYWFTPAIRLTSGDTYEFSYWYNGSASSGGSTTLGMSYGTDQSEGTMIPIRSDLAGVNTSTYQQLIGRFVAPATANYYMGIKVHHLTYGYPGIVIDDIGLNQLPPCTGMPTVGKISAFPGMLCSSGGTTTLDMDMSGVTKAAGLSYRWEYTTVAPSPVFIPSGSAAASESALFTSPSLTGTTWFRCIVKCTLTGDSVTSDYIKVDVEAIAPPYIETFESGIAGVNMPCASNTAYWGSGAWYLYGSPYSSSYPTANNHTPGGSKYLLAGESLGYMWGYPGPQFWFTPAIKFTGGKLYQFSFWYNGTGSSSGTTSVVGAYYGTAQSEGAMTTALSPDLSVNTTIYKQYKQQFVAPVTGNYYIGIKVENPSSYTSPGISIDDIGLEEVPPCSAPVVAGKIKADPFQVCNLGGTSLLDLEGSTLATGLTYEWYTSSAEAGPYTSTGRSGLPFNTDPLSGNTWFKAVVTCTATGMSDTTDAIKIGVGALDVPYTEDFEQVFPGQKPICSDATTDAWAMQEFWSTRNAPISSASNHTPGGKNYLLGGYYLGYYDYTPYYMTATHDNFWFTPGLNLNAAYKYKLSFWYVASSNANRMGVFYGRAQTPGAMTNTLKPLSNVNNTTYAQFDTVFRPATTGIYYIGFQKTTVSLGDYARPGVAFDDINLNYAPCDATPVAGRIASDKPIGTAYCPGEKVRLVSVGGTISLVPGIKYEWERKPLGFAGSWSSVAGAVDSVLYADTLSGYEYRMMVACINTNDTVYSPSYIVPQHPPHPPVAISPAASPSEYCLGDTVKYTATNFSAAVYDWMLDSVVIPGWKFSDLGATDPGTYMVRVTSALSACPAYSNQVKLNINDPGYAVDITKLADSIICDGNSIMLSAYASKAGVSFEWRKNNVLIPGATTSNYLVSTSGYYRVTAFDGISSCPAVSRNVLITVKPSPPAAITVRGGTTTSCADPGITLEANKGAFSYEWLRSGITLSGWTDSTQLITNSGSYSVKVRTSDGCVSVSPPVTVTILPNPAPVITKSGLTLSVTASYPGYQWIRNGSPISGAGSPTLSLTLKGTYRVRVTDANGCEGESNPITVNDEGLGIANVGTQVEQIKIYPNPTDAKVFIESPIALDIDVKDIAGKTILTLKDAREVDLGKYADGVYLFIIRNNGALIKQQRVTKTTNK